MARPGWRWTQQVIANVIDVQGLIVKRIGAERARRRYEGCLLDGVEVDRGTRRKGPGDH